MIIISVSTKCFQILALEGLACFLWKCVVFSIEEQSGLLLKSFLVTNDGTGDHYI